jgi:hypothetical protein
LFRVETDFLLPIGGGRGLKYAEKAKMAAEGLKYAEKAKMAAEGKVCGKSKDGGRASKVCWNCNISPGAIFIRELQDEDRDKNIQ